MTTKQRPTTPLSALCGNEGDGGTAAELWTGCDIRCKYCLPLLTRFARTYPVPDAEGILETKIRPRTGDVLNLKGLTVRLRYHPELWWGKTPPVLLCAVGDPYPAAEERLGVTRRAIATLHYYRVGARILTKSGTRAVRDFQPAPGTALLAAKSPAQAAEFSPAGETPANLGSHPDDAFGATLTFLDPKQSRKWEPGAALPSDRMAALEEAHRRGIPTFAGLTPVVDPKQALELIRLTASFVDLYMLTAFQRDPDGDDETAAELAADVVDFDWPDFAREAVDLCERLDVPAFASQKLDADALGDMAKLSSILQSKTDASLWREFCVSRKPTWQVVTPAERQAAIEESGQEWYGVD